MRKARRNAEQEMPQQASYPTYDPYAGYPAPQDPSTNPMYMNPMGAAPMYNPAAAGYYPPQPGGPQQPVMNDPFNFHNPAQLLQNTAVQNMAMQYVPNLVNQGREVLDREVNKYISQSRVKYYFSVDTRYVAKKLALVLFPFTHQVITRTPITPNKFRR